MANRLIVQIDGDTRGLQRAFGRVDRSADQFARKSSRLGQKLSRGGMFAAAGLSALGFSGYIDDAAETVLKHFGVGGDAATAITEVTLGVGRLAGETGKLNAKFLGKLGLVGLAGAAAYQFTSMALEATGLDEKLKGLGGSVYDLSVKLGLLNDPMSKFEGKAAPTQAQAAFLRGRAAVLRGQGQTVEQVVATLVKANPQFARTDIEALAGARGRAPVVVNGGLHLHGVQDVKSLEEQLGRSSIRRPHTRRGAR